MTPEYTSVYKYWPTGYEKAPMIVTGFRARRLDGETPEQNRLGERYEFLYNTAGEWPQRAFYGVLLSAKNGRFVFRDLERSGMRHTFEYLTPALFRTMAPNVQGGSEILEWTEDELQNYYHQSLVFPQWEEMGRLTTEAAAVPVGTVTQRKDGYDWQKFGPGDWRRVAKSGTRPDKYGPEPGSHRPEVSEREREEVLERSFRENPTRRIGGYEVGHIAPKSGYWRDKALGLPENTNDKYLVDKDKNLYTEKRRKLHELIARDILDRVRPVEKGKHPVAVLTMGAPASGKSSSIDEVTKGEARNMANIDADLVKEYLPEYREAIKQRARNAAALAHEESAQLAESIREQAMVENKSFVFHGVRGEPEYYREFMGRLNKAGYEVNVIFMWGADEEEVKNRADRRAEITGRRVPHDVIEGVMPELTPNFDGIEDLGANAFVYDSRERAPTLAWKREEDQIDAPSKEFSSELRKAKMARTESKDSDTGRPRRGRKTVPEHSAQEVVDLILRGYEHDERVLDELEKTGYRFGKDEGVISGMGDERPGQSYPMLNKKKNRSR